jgi:hypothetical protein
MLTGYPCSNVLRVIGQMLEQQGLDLFDLQFLDDEISVQCGGPIPPYLDLIDLNYSLAQIKAVDHQAKARRQPSFSLVSFDGLPETLRAVGRHIDEEGGQLLRVSNSSLVSYDSITIEYRTHDRKRHEKEILTTAIRDHALRMYKKRASVRATA